MDVATIRTILVYITQPEDSSTGNQFPNDSLGGLSEKTLRRFGMLKACLWTCLAMIVSIVVSCLR